MMFVKRFLAFWYDFIVGDDWLIAAGVLVLLVLAAGVAQTELQLGAWLLLPLGVAAVLSMSLRRATERVRLRQRTEPSLRPSHEATASVRWPDSWK